MTINQVQFRFFAQNCLQELRTVIHTGFPLYALIINKISTYETVITKADYCSLCITAMTTNFNFSQFDPSVRIGICGYNQPLTAYISINFLYLIYLWRPISLLKKGF